MASEIEKYLRKLSKKERQELAKKWFQVLSLDWSGLNIQKIKGSTKFFRIRVGKHRIIFELKKNSKIRIVKIARRNEKTYK
tara:strand:- start:234 stop:476 length:243 start_codon:yes stop_codon:yes gene_type:complete